MADRTYDWNGHTNLPISYPQLSDFHMAGKVRMLMRSDLDHEGVVCGARDRIMCLSKEKASLVTALKLALDHIEHMAAFIGSQKLGYSFESLGEDMPGMRAAGDGKTLPVTVADINAAFDPADEALGGAFKAGFREGWLFATSPDFEDREEAEEDYQRAVDIAPSECWDAYREVYFAKLPLAAIPKLTVKQTAPAPEATGGADV